MAEDQARAGAAVTYRFSKHSGCQRHVGSHGVNQLVLANKELRAFWAVEESCWRSYS